MPIIINLLDVPSDGQSIECEIGSSEIALSSDDGKILNSLKCIGQVFTTDGQSAIFQGTLTGKVGRECVRCLISFEDDVSLSLDAQFRPLKQSSNVSVSSKRMKKGSRRHESVQDDEQEDEIDTYPIEDYHIDLLPVLREHLILAAPLQPLCNKGCAGLCQVCGVNLNEGVCGCCSPVTASSSLIPDAQNSINITTSQHS